jgi:hypothetical protein
MGMSRRWRRNAKGQRATGDLSTPSTAEAIGVSLTRSRVGRNKQGIDRCSESNTSLVSSSKGGETPNETETTILFPD